MPNWCCNRLIVKVEKEGKDIAAALGEIKELKEGLDRNGGVLFGMLLPVDTRDREEAMEIWGTKWDPEIYNLISERDEEGEIERLEISCYSAWSPPEEGIILLSYRFSNLVFKLEYYEVGMDFQGRLIVRGGKILERLCETLFHRVRIICPRCLSRVVTSRSLDDEDYYQDINEEYGTDEPECDMCGERLQSENEKLIKHQQRRGRPIWGSEEQVEEVVKCRKSKDRDYIEIRISGEESIETIIGRCRAIRYCEERLLLVDIEEAYRYALKERSKKEIRIKWAGDLDFNNYVEISNAERCNINRIIFHLDKESRRRYLYLEGLEPAVFVV